MSKRIRKASWLLVLLVVVAVPNRHTYATEFNCAQPLSYLCCQYQASCSGTYASGGWTYPCQIQCYDPGPEPGTVVPTGTANCGKIALCPP
jgi:hypothetical protein